MNVQSWILLALVLVVAVIAARYYWCRPDPCAGCSLKDSCTKQSCKR